jgi:uncharacterized protein (TIGR02145 family)
MLQHIVKQIVAENGEQILSEPGKVNAFFKDLAKDEPKAQKRAFIECLEPKRRYVKTLKGISKEDRQECIERFANEMREEGLDLQASREALAMLCAALFNEEYAASPPPPPAPQGGSTFTDPRDGKTYRTVKIGNQTWMVENLCYDAPGSKCYGNDPKNAAKYGRLYSWEAARKAVPPGWHLASDAEWETLVKAAGGENSAGKCLKAKSGWDSGGGLSDGSFLYVGNYGKWWSSTEISASSAWSRGMFSDREVVSRNDGGKSCLFSVRCVKD